MIDNLYTVLMHIESVARYHCKITPKCLYSALLFDFISTVRYVKNLNSSITLHFALVHLHHTAKSLSYHFTNISGTYFGPYSNHCNTAVYCVKLTCMLAVLSDANDNNKTRTLLNSATLKNYQNTCSSLTEGYSYATT